MAKQVLKNAGLYLGAYELSGILNNITIEADSELPETSCFGATARQFVRGLRGVRFGCAGYFDPAAGYDGALFDAWQSTSDQIFTACNENSAGNLAWFMRGAVPNYGLGGSFGQAATVTLNGQSTVAPLVRGTVMARSTAAASSGAGSGYQLGAVGATESIYAALHVFSVDGTDPELDVIIESDADGNFAAGATTRLTFTTATDVGAEWKEAGPGAITDQYWRASYTIGGTDPVFGFIVSFGFNAG